MKTKRLIHNPSGFTLLESLFAAILIGLVIAALVASNSAFTMANAAGVDLSTAEFLIEEIRELTATMSFDELDSIGKVHEPPIDMNGQSIEGFEMFTQDVKVYKVLEIDYNTIAPDSVYSDFKRIVVEILKNDRPISKASWIRARLE